MNSPDLIPATAPAPKRTWVGAAAFLGLLLGAVAVFFLVRHVGEGLTAPAPAASITSPKAAEVNVVLHVVATLVAVIALGHVLGAALRYVGQPPVIGEVLAGILLGPSLLGAISPEAMNALIPSAAVDPTGQVAAALKAVAQLGVILYMFLVGLDLNANHLKQKARTAVAVSSTSIVVSFVCGAALALGLYPTLAHAGVPFTTFALFMGVSMAISAFPVLARILTDRGMAKTELGVVALGCAAADNVTAWCLLALVVGVAEAKAGAAVLVLAGAAAFIAAMVLVVKPVVARVSRRCDATVGPLPPVVISGTFLGLLSAALATEAIGIHAIFGAFLFGVLIPHDGRIAKEFTAKLKDPATVLLLPAFFAFTGMRTQFGLLSGWQDWAWCAAIIVVASAGKFGGALVAAKLAGQSWRSSAALGALLNTRGLMELVILNIGLDMGVISPTLFAMMVMMALVTTAATVPLLNLLVREPATGTTPPAGPGTPSTARERPQVAPS
jgi:Kef-type K+ transport system membrane component KefB